MLNTKFGRNQFQNGCILTMNSLLDLHKYLNEKYQVKYLMTSHVDQDYVEVAVFVFLVKAKIFLMINSDVFCHKNFANFFVEYPTHKTN